MPNEMYLKNMNQKIMGKNKFNKMNFKAEHTETKSKEK